MMHMGWWQGLVQWDIQEAKSIECLTLITLIVNAVPPQITQQHLYYRVDWFKQIPSQSDLKGCVCKEKILIENSGSSFQNKHFGWYILSIFATYHVL